MKKRNPGFWIRNPGFWERNPGFREKKSIGSSKGGGGELKHIPKAGFW
jgi:hypothetical protein